MMLMMIVSDRRVDPFASALPSSRRDASVGGHHPLDPLGAPLWTMPMVRG
jgi:hypothetical protein